MVVGGKGLTFRYDIYHRSESGWLAKFPLVVFLSWPLTHPPFLGSCTSSTFHYGVFLKVLGKGKGGCFDVFVG